MVSDENVQGPRRSDTWKDDEVLEGVVRTLVEKLLSGDIINKEQLQNEKILGMREKGLRDLPTNSMVLDYIRLNHPDDEASLIHILKKKPSWRSSRS